MYKVTSIEEMMRIVNVNGNELECSLVTSSHCGQTGGTKMSTMHSGCDVLTARRNCAAQIVLLCSTRELELIVHERLIPFFVLQFCVVFDLTATTI